MRHSPAFASLLALFLAACASHPAATTASSPGVAHPAIAPLSVAPAPQLQRVPESFVSAETPAEELDSAAAWTAPDGHVWVIVTGKSTHRLDVYDGETGARLREVGGEGQAAGEFNRPNGVAVYGDYLFVVERDNHRVQVFTLPDFKPLGIFGDQDLRSPYGLWLTETEPGELEVYVTDSFMYGKKFDEVPPLAELDQRVRRYRVHFDQNGRLRSSYGGSFGDTTQAAGLRMVESIAGDPANDRLLIADEDRRHESTLREYSFSGKYTGRSLPQDSFAAEAEGVALWTCANGNGYWIAVDQLAPLTVFHLFDRATLAPRGSFEGEVTAHTDGVALHAASTPAFPDGALFAVHDDKSVTAFDLSEVVRVLGLSADCTR
jgi:3-phytase